jgi:hypothetical protein
MHTKIKQTGRIATVRPAPPWINACLLACLTSLSIADRGESVEIGRPKWDQQQAIHRVKSVIEQENAHDFAWDKIAWLTDPTQAAALAKRDGKPILLYFFLRGQSGPPAAPC